MTSLAQEALGKLLRRAENAAAKPSARSVTLRFSESSFPAYFDLRLTREERTRCHGELELAKRAGAIEIQWDRRAGPGNQVEALRLIDASALAKFLDADPRWDVVARAESALAEAAGRHPVLLGLFPTWRTGKKVCNTTAAEYQRWIDAVRILDLCRSEPARDVAIRRFSTRVLGNSKKVESLTPLLNVLLQAELDAPDRDVEDILHELGLVKYPPTILLAGAALVRTSKGRAHHADEPYLGLPPASIERIEYLTDCPSLMTIENLETFHEAARLAADRRDWVVLYTGGMPCPSWKQVFSKLVASLSAMSTIWHWGDIDAGGFRIADHIATCCAAFGQTLQLHGMVVPTGLDFGAENAPRSLKRNELAAIAKVCEPRGWTTELEALVQRPYAIEQELLDVVFPRDGAAIEPRS
ncbi:Wadjet anti-phage system protein JetD domain-containing protein [Variovorax paradoxus]|uniref:Wadjet anti-phage system protein JetD domain-containing protein n=1 Tax=Variovorax paradoxus TaxID=34073 RepID=UPI0027844AB7|nr:Wadjet anti-phage system protein JetD domain-containing protein [Variovorax paradoxus]MDP9933488.1 hypothetical protein [Variovorax paradoxus]